MSELQLLKKPIVPELVTIQLMLLINKEIDHKRLIMDSSVDTYYVFKAVYKSTAILSGTDITFSPEKLQL